MSTKNSTFALYVNKKIYNHTFTVKYKDKKMAKSREKFVDLAQNRVARVIKDLRLIGNLSNKSNYEYSIDDVEKIMSTLKSELSKTQKKFDLAASNKKDIFKL